jgi:hypothetical protein
MTISTTASRISYNGNGVTVAFSFPYRFLADRDVVVVLRSSTGVESILLLGTHYSLTGAGADAGGTVTMVAAPAVGERLVIYRSVALTQETDYISGDPFPAETHERALDRLTMIGQQLQDSVDRTLRFPVSDTVSAALPTQAVRANRLMAFDSQGNPTVAAPVVDSSTDVRLDLAASTGAGLVGKADGGTVQDFIDGGAAAIVADDGEGGALFTQLQQALDRIDWSSQERPIGVSALRYIPPAQWAAIFARTSTYDCTANLQAWVDSFATHKGKLYAPTGRYRITELLTLRIATASNADTLTIEGDGDLNTQIWLDNNAASGIFSYDNGWAAFDVANCSTTSGSGVVTTTGSFASVSAGMSVSLQGFPVCNVTSKESDTQITLDRTASATASGLTARVYNIAAAARNRLRLRNLYLTHSQTVVAKTSWHSGTAMLFNGVVNSEFENIRINGFTRGVDMLGGWMNTFKNVLTNGCREGFYIVFPAYRWVFERCATVNSGGASIDWAGTKLIDGGGISFYAPIIEQDQIGIELQGIRGWTIDGGNIESVNYGAAIIIKGLTWATGDERHWTQGGKIGGLRFYNALGIFMSGGVKGLRISGNTFEVSNPPFSPNGQSWIRTTGENNLVKDIDEGGNTFPPGLDSITHILAPAGAATLAMAQSITRNGIRYSSGAPYYGKYWAKGDRLYRQPADVTAGSYEGWVCTVAATGADGSATWKQFGTVQA